jgi:ParB/RepB/Spo0J family partition protein
MEENTPKTKTRQGSGYLKQLYSTARVTAGSTHSHLKNLTTFLVNFVPVDKVDASELQVRTHFDDAEVAALSHSVKEHGVLQPILVVQDGDRYKVIAGERRLRASKLAGLDRIPARILSTDDKATHEIALRENLDRVDLHPIEEGEGYVSLLEAQAYTSHESIAKAFGKPKSRITECIGFTRLPASTKAAVMSAGIKNRAFLRSLLQIPEAEHLKLIESSKEKEVEELVPGLTTPAPKKAKTLTEVAQSAKPSYVWNERGLNVSSFRWKTAQGNPVLERYASELKALLEKIEEHLTNPNLSP